MYRLWFNATCLSFLRDFLPRGSGIVTRRPLVLQLISASAGGLTHIYSRANTSSDTKPPPLNCLAVAQMQQPALIPYVFLFFLFKSRQSGPSSCTAKARSSQTLTRCAKRSRRRRIESPEPTREYLPSPSTCGFTPLTVRDLKIVSPHCL